MVKTYQDALALLPPWERFKMRCFSLYLTFEAWFLKERSKARIRRECGRSTHE